ncbi:MAG: bifunctional NUDIX hydrolase/histidine phosphatase family protein [Mycobacteriaceae bacterium]
MSASETATASSVRASGGVPWRRNEDGTVQVALVHRPAYDDWTLPKGHVERGEHRAVTAVREIAEETGYQTVLGRHLGVTSYPVGRTTKVVDYWAAEVTGGSLTADPEDNTETDEVRWLAVGDATALLTHSGDAAVLQGFARARAVPADPTRTLLLVRHARAGDAGSVPDDARRPLQRSGLDQAQALVPVLLAFGAGAVHAADRTRCVQTVTPLASRLGVPVQEEPLLSEEGWADRPGEGRARAEALRAEPGATVVCSQGGVIPRLVAMWAQDHQLALPSLRTAKASVWVVSSEHGQVVAIDHLPDPYR